MQHVLRFSRLNHAQVEKTNIKANHSRDWSATVVSSGFAHAALNIIESKTKNSWLGWD
jgi:hypothetical protein